MTLQASVRYVPWILLVIYSADDNFHTHYHTSITWGHRVTLPTTPYLPHHKTSPWQFSSFPNSTLVSKCVWFINSFAYYVRLANFA